MGGDGGPGLGRGVGAGAGGAGGGEEGGAGGGGGGGGGGWVAQLPPLWPGSPWLSCSLQVSLGGSPLKNHITHQQQPSWSWGTDFLWG